MITWLALSALAQDVDIPEMNAQTYRPPIDARTMLWTEDASLGEPRSGVARLVLQYANRPMVYVPADPDVDPLVIVSDVLEADLAAGYYVGPARFGVNLPVYLLATGQQGRAAGLGDLQLDAKVSALEREDDPIGLALAARVTLPSATVVLPLGQSGVGGELLALADVQYGDFVTAVNLGTRFNPSVDVGDAVLDDQLFFRLGESWAFSDAGGLSLDLGGHLNYSAPLTAGNTVPLEGLLGGWYRVGGDWVVRGGAGTGLTPGIGAPVFRAILGIALEPDLKDTDGDGLVDRSDACPLEAEDPDGFADEDGCPDTDNDGDGMVDTADGCPNDAEDKDSIVDDDGCPEPELPVVIRLQDPDGRPVAAPTTSLDDKLLIETDTATYDLVLLPGIYALDATAKGYEPLDEKVTIPEGLSAEIVRTMTPATPMGALKVVVLDTEGKPIPEATWQIDAGRKNNVGDDVLAVPPGEYVVTVRAPGYGTAYAPADVVDGQTATVTFSLAAPRVEITEERVDLKEKVFFDTGKSTIKKESWPLLDEVALLLKDHPEIRKIRIEGHTDSRGSESSNLRLSDARAKSVMKFLTDRGVEPERLEAIGYGESRPLDPAETAEAWEMNRRVDIFIVERD